MRVIPSVTRSRPRLFPAQVTRSGQTEYHSFALSNGKAVMSLSRRTLLQGSLLCAAEMVLRPSPTDAQELAASPTPVERKRMATVAAEFMNASDVPGLSVAIAIKGKPDYVETFGVADRETGEALTPQHRFRIASISKPITSVGIFTLVEQGRLSPTDRVFGEHGILSEYQLPANDQFVGEITIDHLLTHTVGGWGNSENDPMNLHQDLDHRQLIAWTLENLPLSQQPGTDYSYSNFGYCLLGRVIEKITGQYYPDYVRQSVLGPSQAEGMRIAGSRLEERAEGEVVYHRQEGRGDPYGMNVARSDSCGGWLASPADLVRFMINLDEGTARSAAILKPATVAAMTAPSDVNSHYARGWFIYGHARRWHTGALPGTSAVIVHTSSGLCWAALANSRNGGLNSAIWEMVRSVEAWGYS
jgi:CubicO group peptidase (beta-lactamase class C family)